MIGKDAIGDPRRGIETKDGGNSELVREVRGGWFIPFAGNMDIFLLRGAYA